MQTIPLGRHHPYFLTVQAQMKASVRCGLRQVEQIVNPYLSPLYDAMKAVVIQRNGPNILNERDLWHGTSAATAAKISQFGYNHGFCQPLAAFGMANYFAIEPALAALKKYATPDANGVQTLIRTKVLTGRMTNGAPNLVEPPPLGPGLALYDTVCDDDQDPSIVAVYDDVRCLPEFVVKFKKY